MNTTKISIQPILSATTLTTVIALCAFTLLMVVLVMIHKKKDLPLKYIKFSTVAVIVLGILFFGTQYMYQTNQNDLIIDKISQTHHVTNLTKTDGNNILCNKESKGTLSAATWKTGKKYHVGVILGKKEKDRCVFSLKSVG